jgi:polysaccharide biosynthesis/export protein
LQGPKTLVEVLSMAGGPREDAGYMARITRRKEAGPLPLPTANVDATGLYNVAEVNLQRIMDTRNPAENIMVMPNDIINVPKADMVYVIGEVQKAGAIALGDQKTVTVLQAISIAAGIGKTAKSTEAKILRITPGSNTRTEVTVNLKAMLAGKLSDIPMEPDDILFVPTSLKKDIGLRALEALGGTGVTSVIYRIP